MSGTEHTRQHETGVVVEPIEVRTKHIVPFVAVHEDQQVIAANTGVVDQHIEMGIGMPRLPGSEGRLCGGGIGDIVRQQFGMAACCGNRTEGFLCCFGVASVINDDRIPVVRQTLGYGTTYAATAARD